MADELVDDDYPDDVDPALAAARDWGVADAPKATRRKKKFQKLIEAGALMLHPDHLEFLAYVQNWAEVERTLPTFSAKSGRYRDRVRPMRLGKYRVYCLDLMLPTIATVQQLMNYRTRQGRSLRDVPDAFRPVSRSHALLDGDGSPVVGVMHTYHSSVGLLNELHKASQQLRESRQRERGWEPLRDAVLSVGVENGGLWLQTVFAPARADGAPDWERAQGALAPADAASRKAVCDSCVDPDGKLATVPVLKPRRSDIYGGTEKDPSGLISVPEAVAVHLAKAKASVASYDFVEDLPDEARELLHTTVMPVRLAYRVTDSRGRDVRLDGPALFRAIQQHFHGPEHLGHPPAEAERLVADDVYAALRRAMEEGAFEAVAPADGCPARVAWTPALLDAVCGEGPKDALAEIGLPPTWQGAVAAALMLVFGDGPERAVIGKALKSRPQGGRYGDRLDERRLSLLREWVFGELAVNRRAFDQVDAKALFEDPLRAWNGDTGELVERIRTADATVTETALFGVLATVAAARHGMQVVDIGSRQEARGFASVKAYQALRGRLVRTAPTSEPRLEFLGCGPVYLRALLTDQLLLQDPTPDIVDGIQAQAPTVAGWRTWAAGKTGKLSADGSPVEPRRERAALTDDAGGLLQNSDGTVCYELIDVPQLAPADFLDQFSTQALTRRAKESEAAAEDLQTGRPLSADERATDALDEAGKLLPALGREIGKLEGIQDEGFVFDAAQRDRLARLALDVRGAGQPDRTAVGGRIDALVRTAHDREGQFLLVQETVALGNRAAAADLDDEDGGQEEEFLLTGKDGR
ncbi:hypothetical protein [Streptomyces sp. NRRL B-24484]|uniref:hypothetical protein n=1 Tax=Streptomyces sp. NRRL B-24484 TaxID=1463833 RepID=UPI0004C02E41|nr:hypothetical protein [Streptomyces sp. NRRL B-24484]